MAKKTLVERNWDAFRKRQPDHWALLKEIGTPVSKLVIEDGEAVNIDLGKIRLYPEAGAKWTGDQIDQYFLNPDRITFTDPWHCNISDVSAKVLNRLTTRLIENGLSKGEGRPVTDTGYAFVFGVGLGYHLPELVDREICRHIILIEPMAEFIIHSFSAIDWGKVFSAASKKKMNIYFLVNDNPEEIVDIIGKVILKIGATFLDGSYAYIHYYSWVLKESRLLLNQSIKNYYVSPGYFEDEIIMMSNTYGNFTKWPFHLVTRKPYLEQAMPVFVVGSGPSLDKDMPYIKKWRDRVIVFSCGTSLGILLKNGVRPDLHVENENTPELVDNLRNFQKKYGFDGVTLVVTTSVHPDVGALFENRWYYFRAALSSSVVLVAGAEPLLGADPLVSNAAFAVSAAVGFRNIYFFGVDCGSRVGGAHHSKDAVYYQDDYDNFAEGESLEFIENQLNREAPANFGGKAMTSWCLDLSRLCISKLQRLRQVNLFNCSDGVKIDGAKPKAAAAIKLTNPPAMQKNVLSQIERQLLYYEAGAFLDPIDLAKDVEGCDVFIKGFKKMTADAKRKDKGFWDFEQRLEKFWNDNYGELKAVLKITGGSFYAILRLGAFLGNRIMDEKKRLEFMRYFLDEYCETCVWMARETKKLLVDIDQRKTELSQVGVTTPDP